MPNNKSHYEKLKDKWVERHKNLQKEIFAKHRDSFEWLINNSKQLALGSLVGMFVLASPIVPKVESSFNGNKVEVSQNVEKNVFLSYDLKNVLPQDVRSLTPSEEEKVAEILTRTFNINVMPEFAGKRLNTNYGLIGQEQHLARFPGDNLTVHFDSSEESKRFSDYGMAPGLGAWGYFADSQSSLTQENIQREKYYIAVQTFLAKGFENNPSQFINFFKYRKMLVVNPQNGKAVVVDIADSGPAAWTGKQFGGSPEVMQYLERADGDQKGPVLIYFIDDPENNVQLGPIGL